MSRYSPALLGTVATITPNFTIPTAYSNGFPLSTESKIIIQRSVNSGSLMSSLDIDAINTDWMDCKIYSSISLTLENNPNNTGDYYVLFWANGNTVPVNANDSIYVEFMNTEDALNGNRNPLIRTHNIKSRWLSIMLVSQSKAAVASFTLKTSTTEVTIGVDVAIGNVNNSLYTMLTDANGTAIGSVDAPEGAGLFTTLVDNQGYTLLTTQGINNPIDRWGTIKPVLGVGLADNNGYTIDSTDDSPLSYKSLSKDASHNVILAINSFAFKAGNYATTPLDKYYGVSGDLVGNVLTIVQTYTSLDGATWTQTTDNAFDIGRIGLMLDDTTDIQEITFVKEFTKTTLTFNRAFTLNPQNTSNPRFIFSTQHVLSNIQYDILPDLKKELDSKSNLFLLSLNSNNVLIPSAEISSHILRFIQDDTYSNTNLLNTQLTNLSVIPNAKDKASIIMFALDFSPALTTAASNYIKNNAINTYVVNYGNDISSERKDALIKAVSMFSDKTLHYITLKSNAVGAASNEYRTVDDKLIAIVAKDAYVGHTALSTTITNNQGTPQASLNADISLNGVCMFNTLIDNSGFVIGTTRNDVSNALYVTLLDNSLYVAPQTTSAAQRYSIDKPITAGLSLIFDSTLLTTEKECFDVRTINLVNDTANPVWVRIYDVYPAAAGNVATMQEYIKLNVYLAPNTDPNGGCTRELTFHRPAEFLYGMYAIVSDKPDYTSSSNHSISDVYLTVSYEPRNTSIVKPSSTQRKSPTITATGIVDPVTGLPSTSAAIQSFDVDIVNSPSYLLSGWILNDPSTESMTYAITSITGDDYTLPSDASISINSYIISPGGTRIPLLSIQFRAACPAYPRIPNIQVNDSTTGIAQLKDEECVFYLDISMSHDAVAGPTPDKTRGILSKSCRIWGTIGGRKTIDGVKLAWNSSDSRGGFIPLVDGSLAFVTETKKVVEYNPITHLLDSTYVRFITFVTNTPGPHNIAQVDYRRADGIKETSNVALNQTIEDSNLIKIITSPDISFSHQTITVISSVGSAITDFSFSSVHPFLQSYDISVNTDLTKYFGNIPEASRLTDLGQGLYQLVSPDDRMFTFSNPEMRGHIYYYDGQGSDLSGYFVSVKTSSLPVELAQFLDAEGNWDSILINSPEIYTSDSITPLYMAISTPDNTWLTDESKYLDAVNDNIQQGYPDLFPMIKSNTINMNPDPGATLTQFVYDIPLGTGSKIIQLPVQNIKGKLTVTIHSTQNGQTTDTYVIFNNLKKFILPEGITEITIEGDFKKIGPFNGKPTPLGMEYLMNVFGINNNATNLLRAFENAENLIYIDDLTGTGSNITTLNSTFKNCGNFQGDILSNWEIQQVTDMSATFMDSDLRIVDLSTWNVSKVVTMTNTFANCNNFKGNGLSSWLTPSLETLEGAFKSTGVEQLDLSAWNVSRVTNMYETFSDCSLFNGDLSNWDVSSVTLIDNMFYMCPSFTGTGLSTWNPPRSLSTLNSVFYGCKNFNADMSSWDVSYVETMNLLFRDCSLFNSDLSNWRTPVLTSMDQTFRNCHSFNGSLSGWDVSRIPSFSNLFNGCHTFAGTGLDTWDTQSITNLNSTFLDCRNFNTAISSWTTNQVTNMDYLFKGCSRFNKDLLWTTSSLETMTEAFRDCTDFDGSLTGWQVYRVTNMSNLFNGCHNFTGKGLNTWLPQLLNNLENTFKDCRKFNTNINNWNVSNVTNMNQLFMGCTSFNTDLNLWNTNSLVTMCGTFMDCSVFNGDLGNWGVTGVTNMSSIFNGCRNFTGRGLDTWSTGNVGNFTSAFENCSVFNSAYVPNWNMSSATNINQMFKNCVSFNRDLTNWSGTNSIALFTMCGTFMGCTNFNGNLTGLTVQGVGNMANLFNDCKSFTGTGLNTWQTNALNNLEGTFQGCSIFNRDISFLKINGVTNMNQTFKDCTLFNQALNGTTGNVWNTQSLTTLCGTFMNCTAFDSSLENWNLQHVTNMDNLFNGCVNFTGKGLSTWNPVAATSLRGTFEGCVKFKPDASFTFWEVSHVTTMDHLFKGCLIFDINPPASLAWNATALVSMCGTFMDCPSLVGSVADFYVDNVTNMSHLFKGCTNFNGNGISTWRPTAVTNLSSTFEGCQNLNTNELNIYWPVNKVTNMDNMLKDCIAFNQDLSNWSTPALVTICGTFMNCVAFDGDLSGWNVQNVTNMSNMFNGCSVFTGRGLELWTPQAVTNLSSTFRDCQAFNADISSWNVANVTNLSSTFRDCQAFNADISSWNVANVTNMDETFRNCFNFNKNLTWNTPALVTLCGTFMYSSQFNGNLSGWNVQNVTNMSNMFSQATSFSGNGLNTWRTQAVTNLDSAFYNCAMFNADISSWGVSNVTNMAQLFYNAANFNSDLLWHTPALLTMNAAFFNCLAFNGDLSGWDVTKVTNFTDLFRNCSQFTGKGLNTWRPQAATSMYQTFKGCTNFNQNLNNWRSPALTNLYATFYQCTNFNQNLNNWRSPALTNLYATFYQCTNFNGDLSGWDVSSATNMTFTFYQCTNFTGQGLNTWRPSNVNMDLVFTFCSSFNQDLSDWRSKPTGILNAFRNCTSFDGSLHGWDISGVNISDFANLFNTCLNFTGRGLETWRPKNITTLNSTFYLCGKFNADISSWNVSSVTNMPYLFYGCSRFNQDLSNWRPNRLTNMTEAFRNCTDFDGSLHGWDVSGIVNMSNLFNSCTQFTGRGLETWNPRSVTNFTQTFLNCSNFNADISAWNLPLALNMTNMFSGCTNFNRNLRWYTPEVTNMTNTFLNCSNFDGSLDWSVNKVSNMSSTFSGCTKFTGKGLATWQARPQSAPGAFLNCVSFNQNLSGWDVTTLTSLENMFRGCQSFVGTGLDSWNLSSVSLTSLDRVFDGCSSFNTNLIGSGWTVSRVTNLNETFRGCTTFGQGLNSSTLLFSWAPKPVTMCGTFMGCINFNPQSLNWDVSAATNMRNLFSGCTSLQSPSGLSSWNTKSVTVLEGTFEGCTNFNANINGWNVSKVTNMNNTFANCPSAFVAAGGFVLSNWKTPALITMCGTFMNCTGLGSHPFDLSGWDVSAVTNMSSLFSGCTNLTGLLNLNIWNPKSVTNLSRAFYNCQTINMNLNTWVTPNLVNMIETFYGCSQFNGNLSGWNVTNVTNMAGLFQNCQVFTGTGLSGWRPQSVTNMNDMFNTCRQFNQNLSDWRTPSLTSMTGTFLNCSNFNGSLQGWDVSGVTDFSGAFTNCTLFTGQGLSSWNTKSATNMRGMFENARAFNVDISQWNIGNITPGATAMTSTSMFNIFYYTNLSDRNLASIIEGWASQTVIPINIHLGILERPSGTMTLPILPSGGLYLYPTLYSAYNLLTTQYGWIINVVKSVEYP